MSSNKLSEDWREDLSKGFSECFRVLASDGVLVFKWTETQVKLREVLALTSRQPLFGNTSGKKAGTHWLVFMKPSPSTVCTKKGYPDLDVGADQIRLASISSISVGMWAPKLRSASFPSCG